MFKGGLGFGGTCFPVDARSFKKSQIKAKIDPVFTEAIMSTNDHQIERTVDLIKGIKGKKVTILGITYKPNVHLVTESQALGITKKLVKTKSVMIYDPRGMKEARKELGKTVKYARNLRQALKYGDIILIAVQWPIFSMIGRTDLRKNQTIIDPWRLLKGRLDCKYIPFGKK